MWAGTAQPKPCLGPFLADARHNWASVPTRLTLHPYGHLVGPTCINKSKML